ncbi:MAG: lamin tail domain-containing protein [Candidatus Eisenbacteria bacterium]|nr:lamin tail domain-containing protein [Candidatus Eisenbacteria bacterium]
MRAAFALPCLALLCVSFFVPVPPASADSPLRLNEFMAGPARDWDGSGTFSSRDDEWVEVINTDPAALNLAGFFFTDGDSLPRYAFSGTLAPGERRLIFGKDAYDWEKATGHPAFGLSLANSGDAVMLWRIVAGETLLVDSYRYGSHEAGADRAVGRFPDGSGAWALFDSLDPYTGTTAPLGTGCAPTPGQPNLCTSTPTRRVTWGEVKSRYH